MFTNYFDSCLFLHFPFVFVPFSSLLLLLLLFVVVIVVVVVVVGVVCCLFCAAEEDRYRFLVRATEPGVSSCVSNQSSTRSVSDERRPRVPNTVDYLEPKLPSLFEIVTLFAWRTNDRTRADRKINGKKERWHVRDIGLLLMWGLTWIYLIDDVCGWSFWNSGELLIH